MLEVNLTIRLTLCGPILTQSSAIGAPGMDAVMARDSAGRYYLPFSLLRGRLRQSWEELSEATPGTFTTFIEELLGYGSDDAPQTTPTRYEPQRGCLHVTDFLYDGPDVTPEVLYRIRMDPARGAADQGAMQVIESPFAPGQRVAFKGCMSYPARDTSEVATRREAIFTGLRWITHIGAERTAGFGRLIAVELFVETHRAVPTPATTVTPVVPEVLDLILEPQAPFCLAKRQVNPNLFESDIVIAGGVVRGALVTALNALLGHPRQAVIDDRLPSPWHELGAQLHNIRITHAFPAPKHKVQRPVVAPLSLVKDVEESDFYDVSLCDGPGLIGTPPDDLYAPKFAVDWKDATDVRKSFGWGTPGREMRVRTAIERSRRRAEDEKLFAYEMVVPTGCLWYGRIDLSQVPAGATRSAVVQQLHALMQHGLRGIGKTKTAATVRLQPQTIPVAHPSSLTPLAGVWVVTLQAPALLCDPATLDETSGEHELHAAYATAWDGLSHGALRLQRFFATQSLAGGYLVQRFQSQKPYNPFLLTDAGSVFVLQATTEVSTAQTCLVTWLHTGLPLPTWARERYGEHWSTCPFLPADGFGEITVNLPCHEQRKPPQEVFYAL